MQSNGVQAYQGAIRKQQGIPSIPTQAYRRRMVRSPPARALHATDDASTIANYVTPTVCKSEVAIGTDRVNNHIIETILLLLFENKFSQTKVTQSVIRDRDLT